MSYEYKGFDTITLFLRKINFIVNAIERNKNETKTIASILSKTN